MGNNMPYRGELPGNDSHQEQPADVRSILHLDQDTFFVSVERRRDSRLEGKPVVIGGMGDRGVVASCSYEARQFGIHSAMPVKLARQLCSEAVYIRGDMDLYTRYSNLITDVIAARAPLFEKASIDEHYVDLTGMDRFFGCHRWAGELRQEIINETGLPVSMGLSVNKTVAKVAAGEAKPNGRMEVARSAVQFFLDPLSIRKIPMIGPGTYRDLRHMGIATIGTLRGMPPEMLGALLGKNGKEIWRRANGIDNAPVRNWSRRKSVSNETTFSQDSIDIRHMHGVLLHLCEQLAYRLRRHRQLTGCVGVKIRYANFDTHTLQQRIPYTAFDHVLFPLCKELFRRLHTRRMRVRLLGIQLSHLIQGVQQLNMFEDSPGTIRLYQAVDRMRDKYGPEILGRHSGRNKRETAPCRQ